jgi:Zn-dependent protease
MQPETLFYIIVLIYSIVLHEIAHGFAAYKFGDKTAFFSGRLTLNPIPHIDLFGSLVLPGILLLTGSSLLFGWAKPVPINENNLFPRKSGLFWVAIAGVLVNFLLGSIFMIFGAFIASENLKDLFFIISMVNFSLCFFNLLPFPPADGYRILSVFLPRELDYKINNFLNQNFLPIIILSILSMSFIFSFIFPILRSFVGGIIY